jgi:DNA-binding response OmpR family regulator
MSAPTTKAAEFLQEALAQGRVLILPPTQRAPLVTVCCEIFGLTRAEGRVLVHLLNHTHASRRELHVAMANDDHPTTQVKLVDVVIHRLRKKLTPYNIEICKFRGFGFGITEDAHNRVRKLLVEHGGDIVPAPHSGEAHG